MPKKKKKQLNKSESAGAGPSQSQIGYTNDGVVFMRTVVRIGPTKEPAEVTFNWTPDAAAQIGHHIVDASKAAALTRAGIAVNKETLNQ